MHRAVSLIQTPWGLLEAHVDVVPATQLMEGKTRNVDDMVVALTHLQFCDDTMGKSENVLSKEQDKLRSKDRVIEEFACSFEETFCQASQDVSLIANRSLLAPRYQPRAERLIQQLMEELNEYLHVGRTRFDVALALSGTEFMQKVWRATCCIPYGTTRTYAEIGEAIGAPRAARAVGTALKRNPFLIVVPCHRVVPQSGGIGSYRGGADRKEALLVHEGALASSRGQARYSG